MIKIMKKLLTIFILAHNMQLKTAKYKNIPL